MVPKTMKMNNGKEIPSLGLGTWQSPKGEVAKAIESALKCGYRHIDCAWGYQNEGEVGEGIKASGVPREELFITSKLFEIHHKPEHVELALKDTLEKLGTHYLDLYLMHWTIAFQTDAPKGVVPNWEHVVKDSNGKIKLDMDLTEDVTPTWKEMEKLVEQGLVKTIGVSNFNINRMKKLLDSDIKIKPAVNQVELSIQCPQPELVKWLQAKGIVVEAYSPLGGVSGKALRENAVVTQIADKYSVQGPTILLSWLLKRNIVPLPKSVTPSRIEVNFKTVDLTDEEFAKIEKLAESHPFNRVCDQTGAFEPFYDVYQDSSKEFSDKAMFAKEGM